MTKEFVLPTNKRRELINITSKVSTCVADSKVEEGICIIFVPHATAAIIINEDEAGLKADIENLIETWIPEGAWSHNQIDDNATAHLASALISQSKSIPIVAGKLKLGTWQEIFLLELDGPRQNRKVLVSCISG